MQRDKLAKADGSVFVLRAATRHRPSMIKSRSIPSHTAAAYNLLRKRKERATSAESNR